jgi:hypothetical protein
VHRLERSDGQSGFPEEPLLHGLVHPQRRREDAGPDVWETRELEHPLHRPVLAGRAVQDREDDVDPLP